MGDINKEFTLKRAQNAVLSRDFVLASRLFKTILKSEPNNIDVLSQLGSTYVRSGDDEKALEVYNIWLNNLTDLFQFVRKYFDAKIIILSGGVLKSKDYFLDDLIAKNPNIKIALAKFDQTAGLIGAAYYSFNPQ